MHEIKQYIYYISFLNIVTYIACKFLIKLNISSETPKGQSPMDNADTGNIGYKTHNQNKQYKKYNTEN